MRVAHAVALWMLLLMVGSASGSFAVLAEPDAGCADGCDDQGGGCPPVCGSCLCAARGLSIVAPAAPVMPEAERTAQVAAAEATSRPPLPEPRDISHVPRRPA